MGFSEMLWGAEKLVPAEYRYWCPYGSSYIDLHVWYIQLPIHFFDRSQIILVESRVKQAWCSIIK